MRSTRSVVVFALAGLATTLFGCSEDQIYTMANATLSGTVGNSGSYSRYQSDRKQITGDDLTIAEKIQEYQDPVAAQGELAKLYSPGGSAQALKLSMSMNGFACINQGRRSMICSLESKRVTPRWDAVFSLSGDTVGDMTITPFADAGLR